MTEASVAAPRTRASVLRRQWLDRAFEHAGVDPAHWDPTRGVDVNRRTIEAVYAYYGRLYLRHAQLEWAGLANMIGPSFYAGFLDIGFLPDGTRRLLHKTRGLIRRDPHVDELLVGDLGFFETTFLTMQRKIFEDQALMHEAYLDGGLDAIRELRVAGVVDSATVRAWEQIDAGEPAEVHEGNGALLYREQHDVIEQFYVDMRGHAPPSGRVFTYLLTLAGAPAVPGAKGYTDVFPLTLLAPVSRTARLTLRTPLASGNLARFANRWQLIEEDTLPVYRRLITEKAGDVRALIEQPVDRRAGRFRLTRRAGRIALALLTRWRVALEAARTTPVAADDHVTIDLTVPPTSDSRVWANARRKPFHVSVRLPEGRTFSTEAVLAVLRGTRLTIKLPTTDLDGVRQTLAGFTPEWQLDQAEVAVWAARAAAVTTASHAYSTRVFGAHASASIRLELQVEHHVEHDTYVVDALFSRGAS